jgi:hypothetical protein
VGTETVAIPQLSQDENSIFTADFADEKKSLGPDGFPAEFYQVFWEIVKYDLMNMFAHFQQGKLTLFHLDFGTTVLLPRKKQCSNLAVDTYVY